ncbi:EamA family transporter RarD [Herbiconiux flava]|uniref:Chloramphenicol-sensitive protein RarD n=1 Tax=Herbiconiux flava TaxID=881268 RepID=A0A852SNF2_9MICO|nr:EamA family transporter RarD [Herbiconiux flava]NYD70327.1 chloramphenicol-sensitive protein RarD [Herbiconiux flava]GLK17081.1 protein RarD [Herbiconiux flava]
MPDRSAPALTFRAGLLYAVGAYVLWGVLPLYFLLMQPAGAFEIVAWRILFSLVFCALLLTVTRGWRPFLAIARQPRLLFLMALAGLLIYINWQTYILGTLSGQVVETSLGYFINPIVTVLLSVLVLREKLRMLQWAAIGISLVAVLVLAVGHGTVPWLALVLAASFGTYGLVKKHVGPRVDAVSGLSLETAWLAPLATVQLIVVSMLPGGLVFGTVSPVHTGLMLLSGVATAVPLLMFASATRRLPLAYVGFIQFVAPILQFAIGVFVLHEPMPPERWAGFAVVWVAVLVLIVDMARAARR